MSCSCQSSSSIKDRCMYDIPDTLYNFFPKNKINTKNVFFKTNAEKTDIPFYPEKFSITYIVDIYQYNNFKQKEKK